MNHLKQSTFGLAVVLLAFLCAMTVNVAAQDVMHPPTTKTVGDPTHAVEPTHVQNAEVIHVSGHELVVKLQNGKLEMLNLEENAKFQVDGKDLTIHELTPGTRLSQDIHTVTTPQEVTTLRTLNGRVWHVNAAKEHLIIALPEGGTSEFTVPNDTVFHIDGQDKTLFDLRKGMKISATVATIEPVDSISRHTVVTGQAPPTPAVAFEGPMLIEESRESPVMTATIQEPAVLPQTGSLVPLIGLIGILCIGLYAGLRILHRRTA